MNRSGLFNPLFRTILACLGITIGIAGTAMAATEIVDSAVGERWQTVRVTDTKDEKVTVRGHLLFTTDTELVGAAFRCEKGKLMALVAAEPVDFKQLLNMRFRGSEDWPVEFSINGGEMQNEDWVQMYRGKIFMVKELQTTRKIFEQALAAGQVEFTRKYGKAVNVTMPAFEQDIFDQFVQDCALKSEYIPDFTGALKTASAPEN